MSAGFDEPRRAVCCSSLLRWVAHCLGAGLSPTRLLRDEPTVIHDALAPSPSARGVGGWRSSQARHGVSGRRL